MQKRLFDYPAWWRSGKSLQVSLEARREYAWCYGWAGPNGVFEDDAARLWSEAASFNRPDLSIGRIAQLLDEWQAGKLLFRWTDKKTGKRLCFWVHSDKPGRQPPPSKRGEKALLLPEPPKTALKKWLKEEKASLQMELRPAPPAEKNIAEQ